MLLLVRYIKMTLVCALIALIINYRPLTTLVQIKYLKVFLSVNVN
jgi:hypothetical protein